MRIVRIHNGFNNVFLKVQTLQEPRNQLNSFTVNKRKKNRLVILLRPRTGHIKEVNHHVDVKRPANANLNLVTKFPLCLSPSNCSLFLRIIIIKCHLLVVGRLSWISSCSDFPLILHIQYRCVLTIL